MIHEKETAMALAGRPVHRNRPACLHCVLFLFRRHPQEHYDWEIFQSYLTTLEEAIDQHRDIKQTLQKILPTHHEAK